MPRTNNQGAVIVLRLFGGRFSWLRALALAPVALLVLTGCSGYPQSTLSPAGPVAAEQLDLMKTSLYIMVFVFIIVMVLWLYAIIKYRQRKGDTSTPAQWKGSTVLEAIWIIGPFVLLAYLAYATVSESFVLGAIPAPQKSITVRVTGHQFWWSFDYPGLGILTANELHIPVGTKINLELTSADVIHSFWIPRLGGKMDLEPGYLNHMWLEASRPGIYPGQCAEFCGTGHADMRMEVIAQTPQDFQTWVNEMKHPTTSSTALAKLGMQDFSSLGCATCHAIANTPFKGTVGPNLTALGLRHGIAADTLANTPQNLSLWLQNPPKVKPGALMPDLGLHADQIKALVAFLEGLK